MFISRPFLFLFLFFGLDIWTSEQLVGELSEATFRRVYERPKTQPYQRPPLAPIFSRGLGSVAMIYATRLEDASHKICARDSWAKRVSGGLWNYGSEELSAPVHMSRSPAPETASRRLPAAISGGLLGSDKMPSPIPVTYGNSAPRAPRVLATVFVPGRRHSTQILILILTGATWKQITASCSTHPGPRGATRGRALHIGWVREPRYLISYRRQSAVKISP